MDFICMLSFDCAAKGRDFSHTAQLRRIRTNSVRPSYLALFSLPPDFGPFFSALSAGRAMRRRKYEQCTYVRTYSLRKKNLVRMGQSQRRRGKKEPSRVRPSFWGSSVPTLEERKRRFKGNKCAPQERQREENFTTHGSWMNSRKEKGIPGS